MPSPLKAILRRGREVLLFLATFAFTLIAIDTMLHLATNARLNWRKVCVRTQEGPGFLYYPAAQDDPFFPDRGQPVFQTAMQYIRQIPGHVYVPFGRDARRRGLFPNRQKQAAIVGDSFTIGEGVSDRETLGFFLGQEYKEYNFLNFGQVGIGAKEVAGIIRDEIAPLAGKIKDVIYFYNLNDIEHDWPQEALTDFQNISYSDMPPAGLAAKSTLLCLARKARIMHAETRRTCAIYHNIYLSPEKRAQVDELVAMLAQTKRLLNDNGMRLHIVVYPLLHKNIFGRYPLSAIHALIMRRLAGEKINCLDAGAAFAGRYLMARMRVNPADYHPNGRANALVARFVRENIKLED